MSALDSLLAFVTLTNKYRTVERVVSIQGDDRPENDLEHSGQLAFLAWHLLATHENTLDRDLVLRYALVHDLVEVYAGDTFFYDDEARKDKVARERAALERIRQEFPSFTDLTDHIAQYERHEDPESKFVYALDKLAPMLNIYLSGGRAWKEHRVTHSEQVARKRPAIQGVPIVEPLFNELVERLRAHEPELFSTA